MKKIAYLDNGTIITSTLLDYAVKIDFDYIDITNVKIDCIDACYIEDGEIKIDQQKLTEFNRQKMPNLTKREFRAKLRDAQLFEQVEAYVKSSNDGYLQDAWEYADYFARLDPFIVSSCEKLGLSPEQVDSIWVSE